MNPADRQHQCVSTTMTPVIMSAYGPIFIKGSPHKKHTKPLCGHTKPLCVFPEIKTLLESGCADRQPQCVSTTIPPVVMSAYGPMFIKGSPPLNNTPNLCGCFLKSKHYWKAAVHTDNLRLPYPIKLSYINDSTILFM